MPWSNQSGGSGGPWGQRGSGGSGGGGNNGGGGNPWGGGPKNQGDPSDLDKIFQRGQDRIKGIIPSGGSFNGKGIIILVLIAVAMWLATGFYTVRPNEVGIELVFGRFTHKTAVGAGLQYNWPAPLGDIRKLDVTKQETTQVGFIGSTENRKPIFEEALMLTGDDNVVFINFTVVWNIRASEAENYEFKFLNPKKTVKAVAESTMREYIGRGRILEIITADRLTISPDVQASIQAALDSYQMGIQVSSVQLADALAPEEVRQAFYDVEAASQKAARYLEEAGRTVNAEIPKARGEAAKVLAVAEAYRQGRVAESTGQASRFTQILEEYKKSPETIRQRMYLETMERVYANSVKTIVNTGGSTIINTGGAMRPVVPVPAKNSTTGAETGASAGSAVSGGTQ